jgi:hypothetical protein
MRVMAFPWKQEHLTLTRFNRMSLLWTDGAAFRNRLAASQPTIMPKSAFLTVCSRMPFLGLSEHFGQ